MARKKDKEKNRDDETELQEVAAEIDNAEEVAEVTHEVVTDDHTELADEVAEEADDVAEEAVQEADEAVAEEEAVEEADGAVEEDDDDRDRDRDDDDEDAARDGGDEDLEQRPPPAPRPKVTILTMILIFLNIAGAVAFVFLMSVNFQRRQAWAYATFLRDLEIMGLPLEEEDRGQSGSRAALPKQKLSGEALMEAFKWRGGPVSKVKEGFRDIEEPYKHTIEGRYLTPDILKGYFGALPNPVKTLEDEIKFQKKTFPDLVSKAAKDYVEDVKKLATEEQRRDKVRRAIMPTATSLKHLNELLAKIKATSGDALLAMLEEGIQRRIHLEVLTPIEVSRPGNLEVADEKFLIAHAGDLEAYPLDKLKGLFDKRMDAAIADKFDGDTFFGADFAGKPRGSLEKRQAIGMALLAIAHAHGPDGKLLDDKAVDRARKVLGLWEFAYSASRYTSALGMLFMEVLYEPDATGKDRPILLGLLNELRYNREGADYIIDPKTKTRRVLPSTSFIARFEELVAQIQEVQRDLHSTRKRLEELKSQNALAEKSHAERTKHLAEMVGKLNRERARTKELVAKARELQEELFAAQVELIRAGEANYELEQEIRKLQLRKGKAGS